MGVVTNIIDALRRVGAPTDRSALRRQDAHLEGKNVLERRQVHISDPAGTAKAFIATVEPGTELVAVLGAEELRPIRENAGYGLNFLAAFGVARGGDWRLEDLDRAFEAWQSASDRLGFTDDYVTEVMGAMFGEYCASHLNMQWIRLTDEDGTTLALEGIQKAFRGFPFQTVSKRIRDAEHGFFQPVFVLLKNQSMEANARG